MIEYCLYNVLADFVDIETQVPFTNKKLQVLNHMIELASHPRSQGNPNLKACLCQDS